MQCAIAQGHPYSVDRRITHDAIEARRLVRCVRV